MYSRLTVVAALVMSVTSPVAAAERRPDCDWTQWGQNAAHTGQLCVEGQRDLRLLARMVVDPFAKQEAAESFTGSYLPVHLPTPLVDGDGHVFVLRKGGEYVSCDPPGSGVPAPCGRNIGNLERQTWSVQAMRWQHDRLVPTWSFTSDWRPSRIFGRESLFQSAMSGDFVYVPGAGGTVFQLAKSSGRVVRRINPFGTTVDPAAFASGGLTLDAHGTLFYNVVRSEPTSDGLEDGYGWLVRVTRDRTISMVDYRTLIPGAPRPTDLCYEEFAGDDMPFPPPPQPDGSPTLPPRSPCLSQRAALSQAPAVAGDGTIVTVTRAHLRRGGGNYGYVVALNRDLTVKWATSLRGILNDGCGVLVPYGTAPFDCRPGTALGVDPYTNLRPAAEVDDGSTSSPVVLPDGGIVYGTRNMYNGQRGHLMKFDRTGRYVANYDYGWDITPAVYRHDGTYSMYIKDLHYDGGPYNITRLDADLNKEWSHANTETRTCERLPDGTVSCVDEGSHPNGFEWCISAPAVDRDGTVYGLAADGHFYVIDSQGAQREKVFLSKTIASAYTPVSLDPHGRVYAQNNGELYVLGRG
jgi:outer membrane protein assembly factor BamB